MMRCPSTDKMCDCDTRGLIEVGFGCDPAYVSQKMAESKKLAGQRETLDVVETEEVMTLSGPVEEGWRFEIEP